MFSPNPHSRPVSTPLPAWTRVLALAFGGLCLAAAGGHSPRVPPEDDRPYCGKCYDLYKNTHSAVPDPSASGGAGPAHPTIEDIRWHWWMLPGPCLTTHGVCYYAGWDERPGPDELTDALAQAAARADVAGLAGLVRVPTVRIVASRSAIQVVGCDGEMIVGHVPVDPDVLARVAARTADE